MAQPPNGVHLTRQISYRRCGQKNCHACKPPNKGHGPYVYDYWRDPETHKLRSTYIGRADLTPQN